MDLYISKKNSKEFLKKLKEIRNIDDFILDSERFGKHKIKLYSKRGILDIVGDIYDFLPNKSMIVQQTDSPGKDYVLCTGDIYPQDISVIQSTYSIVPSLLSKKEHILRFNFWVHIENIYDLYQQNIYKNLTSTQGKIQENGTFIIYAKEEEIPKVQKEISKYTNVFIIRGEKIYLYHVPLKKLAEIYKNTNKMIHKLEIIDEENL